MSINSNIKKSFNVKTLWSIVIIVIIIFATFSIYRQLATHQFVSIDDDVYVTANSRVVSGLSWENVFWAFTTLHAQFWHPITWLSYMVDTELFGVKPGGYLFTNLILHILNVLLIFYAFKYMTENIWESGLIAALFALHPLHVEPVAWISERKELLCAIFWTSTILSYAYYTKRASFKRYALVCLFFIFGIMAKPMIITLPFVLLLLDFWPLQRIVYRGAGTNSFGNHFSYNLRLLYEKIPLLIVSLAAGIGAIIAQKSGGWLMSFGQYGFTERMLNALVSYVVYLKKTIWPLDLTVVYPFNDDITVQVFAVSILILIIISVLCLLTIHRRPYLIVGWLWFIGTLFPVIGFIKIGHFAMADRYTYIPLTGIFIMVVFVLSDLFSRFKFRYTFFFVTAIVMLISFSQLTYNQIKTWESSQTLFSHALKVTNNNFFAHHSMGNVSAVQGNMDKAVYHFLKAAEIKPEIPLLWDELGRALIGKNEWDYGIQCFTQAIHKDPEFAPSHYSLGCSLIAHEKIEEGLFHLIEALNIYTKNLNTNQFSAKKTLELYHKALAFKAQGKKGQAIQALEEAILLSPGNYKVIIELSKIYMEKKSYQKIFDLLKISKQRAQLRLLILRGIDYWEVLQVHAQVSE